MKRIFIATLLINFLYHPTVAQFNARGNQFYIRPDMVDIHENINLIYSNHLTAYSFVAPGYQFADSTPAKIPDSVLAEQYLKKGKTREIVGIVFIPVGVAVCIGGVVALNKNYNIFTGSGGGYTLLILLGAAVTITGIALLHSGFRYKKKAKLLMQSGNASSFYHVPVSGKMYSVGFAISLR